MDVPPKVTPDRVAERNADLVRTDDEAPFVEAVVGSLGVPPAKFEEIKAVNSGTAPGTDEVEEIELGPTTAPRVELGRPSPRCGVDVRRRTIPIRP